MTNKGWFLHSLGSITSRGNKMSLSWMDIREPREGWSSLASAFHIACLWLLAFTLAVPDSSHHDPVSWWETTHLFLKDMFLATVQTFPWSKWVGGSYPWCHRDWPLVGALAVSIASRLHRVKNRGSKMLYRNVPSKKSQGLSVMHHKNNVKCIFVARYLQHYYWDPYCLTKTEEKYEMLYWYPDLYSGNSIKLLSYRLSHSSVTYVN